MLREQNLSEFPELGWKIMMSVGNSETAFSFGQLPDESVVLALVEIVIDNAIQVHSRALPWMAG